MTKKLFRSRREKMIAGVAGGLAEYFEIDPTLVRIIFIVSLFLGGTGILAYIILWIVVPEAPIIFSTPSESGSAPQHEYEPAQEEAYARAMDEKRHKRSVYLGAILIIFGMFFLADNYFPHFHFEDFFPLVLIAIGIGLMLNAGKRKNL